MTMEVKLRAEKRDGRGKEIARKLRAQGRVPAVLYSRGTDATMLSIEAHEAERLFQTISVENTIVDLEISGEKQPVRTLIREIQTHPFRPMVFHVDFLRLHEGEKLELEIPLHLVGQPAGVRLQGGMLQQVLHELAVRCVPSEIPETIEIDVSHLELGQALHVSDLNLGEGVEILLEADQVICAISQPRAAAEGGTGEGGAEGGAAGGGEEA